MKARHKMASEDLQHRCIKLRKAYEDGLLGNQTMPEDAHPDFGSQEEKLAFFTLPMALNYQRNSYTLWEMATKAFIDVDTKPIFSIASSSSMEDEKLRELLVKHKVALQPNKHVNTWHRISRTIYENWGSIGGLLQAADYDFLKLQEIVQKTHKRGFPYLSGPKIFHYWCYILGEYGGIELKNKQFIEIAPDTHVIQCSIRLGAITKEEAVSLSRDEISERWRSLLDGSGLAPIDLHSPLWFWSRNKFTYTL